MSGAGADDKATTGTEDDDTLLWKFFEIFVDGGPTDIECISYVRGVKGLLGLGSRSGGGLNIGSTGLYDNDGVFFSFERFFFLVFLRFFVVCDFLFFILLYNIDSILFMLSNFFFSKLELDN